MEKLNTAAAAGHEAINARAGQCEHRADRKDVKDVCKLSFRELRPEPIAKRHKEDGAIDAHLAESSAFGAGLQKGEESDTKDSVKHVQNRNGQCGNPAHPQSFAKPGKPQKGKDGRREKDEYQAVILYKLHKHIKQYLLKKGYNYDNINFKE